MNSHQMLDPPRFEDEQECEPDHKPDRLDKETELTRLKEENNTLQLRMNQMRIQLLQQSNLIGQLKMRICDDESPPKQPRRHSTDLVIAAPPSVETPLVEPPAFSTEYEPGAKPELPKLLQDSNEERQDENETHPSNCSGEVRGAAMTALQRAKHNAKKRLTTSSRTTKQIRSLQELHFARYDLAKSNSINSPHELRQLCTSLAVKLRVNVAPEQLDRLVEEVGHAELNMEQFIAWFDSNFL